MFCLDVLFNLVYAKSLVTRHHLPYLLWQASISSLILTRQRPVYNKCSGYYLTPECHCGGHKQHILTWWTRAVWPMTSTLLWPDHSIRCRAGWSLLLSRIHPPPQSPQSIQSTCMEENRKEKAEGKINSNFRYRVWTQHIYEYTQN